MQPAANNNLVLTDSSSFERFAELKTAISYRGFYQQLASEVLKGVLKNHPFHDLGNRLVLLAEQAHAFRQMGTLEQVSQILLSLPLGNQYQAVGRYYQALCVHRFGRGDVVQAQHLLERVAREAPVWYRLRAIQSLAGNSYHKGGYETALSLYREAGRFASRNGLYDAYATVGTHKMVAVINGLQGNHQNALTLLESLFPLAHGMRSSQPHVYYDYMNSLAVELGEVGRLEEAKNVSRIVLASPFASAYPEWRETSNEIEIKGWRASRSVVAFTTPKASNIVRLPASDSLDQRSFIEPAEPGSPATVLSMQQWKKKMTKKENDTPESEKPFDQMDGRELLLEIMSVTGSKERTDDELLQMLKAINKVLSEPKGKGEK